jgi:hypothetical protein
MVDGWGKVAEICFKAEAMLGSNTSLYRRRSWPEDMPETSPDVKTAVSNWKKKYAGDDVVVRQIMRRVELLVPQFRMSRFVGAGSYGIVFECFDISSPSRIHVCKVVPIMPNIKFPLYDEIAMQKRVAELGMAPQVIDVGNVSASNDAYTARILTDIKSDVILNTVCIVMEKCVKNLSQVISEKMYKTGAIPDLLGRAKGRFVHGDLKCNNVCEAENGLLVFIDFGRGFMCDGLPEDLISEGHLLDVVGLLHSVQRHARSVSGGALNDIQTYLETLLCDCVPDANSLRARRRSLFGAVTECRKRLLK